MEEKKTFESVLEEVGGFGRFQFLILTALLLPEIPAAFVAFAPVFVGRSVSTWKCDSGGGNNSLNVTDMCSCPGILILEGEESFVSEWELVCENSWVSDTITSIQMFGMLIGSLFSSQISDWYGRKWVYFSVCLLMFLGQIFSAFAGDPISYAVARFFAGAGISGFMGMSTIYPLEFMTADYRLLVGSVGPWGEGIMLLALLAYFVPSWRTLLFTSSLPFLIPLLIVPFLPESPRWLLRQGRVDETEKIMTKVKRFNGKGHVNIPRQVLSSISMQDRSSSSLNERFSYLDFFREAELRRKTIFLMGIWFSWSLVYFGISYNVKNLRGNPYINMGLMGLSDALGYPLALVINNRLGRRKSLIIFMSFGALFLVSLSFLEVCSLATPFWVGLLSILGRLGVAGARSAARMLTGESFPTAIRTMGYGISGVTAGVGGILAPQVAYIGSLFWGPLPFLTFAVISILGSLLSLSLPETAGKDLGENLKGPMAKKGQELNYKTIMKT